VPLQFSIESLPFHDSTTQRKQEVYSDAYYMYILRICDLFWENPPKSGISNFFNITHFNHSIDFRTKENIMMK